MTDFDRLKFYDCKPAASPRRVRIYLVEKGIELPTVEVDLPGGEHLQPDFASLNSRCEVPALKLEDGTILCESVAICQYLEELEPNPPLFGHDIKERALTNMWTRRLEGGLFQAAAEAVRNSLPRFSDRALPGPTNFAQIPALAERGKARIPFYYGELDAQLADNEFIVGATFGIADIVALTCVDLAKLASVVPDSDLHPNLSRWYQSVSSRPSASA